VTTTDVAPLTDPASEHRTADQVIADGARDNMLEAFARWGYSYSERRMWAYSYLSSATGTSYPNPGALRSVALGLAQALALIESSEES
jgi:hypothetical protein